MHVVVNKRAIKSEEGFISQKDMAITLFTFMGFHILMPDKFGIVGTREQFEAFNHFWRVIGYMLGTDDKFNCCGETLDDTLGMLDAMREDILMPGLQFPCNHYESYTRIAVDGMWHFDPYDNHYDTMAFMMRRAVKVPGYYYFDTECLADEKDENKKIFAKLSLYTRLRIFLEILIYEKMSHVLIFRWIFNIMRMCLAVLDFHPFLALRAFGKKYAYVEIMKPKK
jgi:hypothetical protein